MMAILVPSTHVLVVNARILLLKAAVIFHLIVMMVILALLTNVSKESVRDRRKMVAVFA